MKCLFICFSFLILSCKPAQIVADADSQILSIDTILSESINIRAIHIDDGILVYGADKSRYGFYDIENKKHIQKRFIVDSLEFRSTAYGNGQWFFVNAGSPAYLFAGNDTGNNKIIYQENHKNAFYDSMRFWNDKEGIAIGDPTSNCLSILITRDGGESWKKIPCESLPKTEPGEAAFATSNTNVITNGRKTWVVSGGKKSRVFYSGDKGITWQVFDTPIIQGKTMTGIFTADFYDQNIGFIAGGDYESQKNNSGNKAITYDGGRTWELVAEKNGPGYISCVQFVPGRKGREIVTVGAGGLYYSSDSGATWKLLYKEEGLYTLRFQNPTTAFAAGRNKIIRIVFKK